VGRVLQVLHASADFVLRVFALGGCVDVRAVCLPRQAKIQKL